MLQALLYSEDSEIPSGSLVFLLRTHIPRMWLCLTLGWQHLNKFPGIAYRGGQCDNRNAEVLGNLTRRSRENIVPLIFFLPVGASWRSQRLPEDTQDSLSNTLVIAVGNKVFHRAVSSQASPASPSLVNLPTPDLTVLRQCSCDLPGSRMDHIRVVDGHHASNGVFVFSIRESPLILLL